MHTAKYAGHEVQKMVFATSEHALELALLFDEVLKAFYVGNDLNNNSNIPTLDSNPSSFYRWNVAGTSTVYQKGATVTFDDDITLYAMWSNTDFTPEKYEDSLVYKV